MLNQSLQAKTLSLVLLFTYSVIFVLLLVTKNVHAAPTSYAKTIKLWPVGDSRVEGFRPVFESYRFELWKRFIDENQPVDFIGQNSDIAGYPIYQNQKFDRDHDGYGGATSADILGGIEEVLTELAAPDVLLLGIGGNDLLESGATVEEVVDNIEAIVRITRQKNPEVIILLEQIAPPRSDIVTPALKTAIEAMNAGIYALAQRLSNPFSKVVSVDMYSGWSDSYMADEVHYNEHGARKVAKRYFEAIMKNVALDMPTIPSEPDPMDGGLVPSSTSAVVSSLLILPD